MSEEIEENGGNIEELIEQFDELFSRSAQGFRPLWRSEMPELLITWESRSQG